MSILRTLLLAIFMIPCGLSAQSSTTSGQLEASAAFKDAFQLIVNDQDEEVNICNLSTDWKVAVVRARGGKTVAKFQRGSSTQTNLKFSTADYESGHYFCNIRFEDGKSEMKSFRKF